MLLRRRFFALHSLWTGALVDTGREQAKRVVRNGKKDTTTSPLCWTSGANTVVLGGYSSFLSIEPLSLIPLVQPSSRTCTIDATKIANSIIKEIRKRATIWHQISGGVERADARSGKTIKKRRLFVEVSAERPLGSGKQITITGKDKYEHAIEDVATYIGKASVDCVRKKYESKGRIELMHAVESHLLFEVLSSLISTKKCYQSSDCKVTRLSGLEGPQSKQAVTARKAKREASPERA
ncbi:hypothetical protein AgCh_033377 [Apium graveolens]